ncbi:MAG: sulfatase-like hydrolase/transferase [candidate division NC10 bacterium]|nr:sulfatase-like hydrolase/transferase [candidate division NC10 bacterium]
MLTTLAAIVVTLLFPITPLQAYETQNVFVVVIDGLRDLEGFEDPTHQYIPRIWNDLRPQGTIYTEFYNDFLTTYTTPGHLAILSGQWQADPNLASGGEAINDVRGDEPTLCEYYRKYTGAPQSACWVVTGKKNNLQTDWALEPAFGPDYKSNVVLGGTDIETFNTLASVLAQDHPNLVLVNFRDVDEAGHTGNWTTYTNTILTADTLVYRIWTELIQGDAIYRDKTTLIVTSDHGRHLPGFGDFENHGGICHGDRHIIFLALGPDTLAGREVTERRYQIDIAPTVGELLGFPTPFARGQTLTGIFEDGLNPNPRLHVYQQNPKVTIFNQTVFVVWSENDLTDTGTQRVYLKKKPFTEPSFSAPLLINDATAARWAFSPSVATNKDGLHVVWLDGRALDARGDTWSVFYRRSPDYGTTWDQEQLIVTSQFETDTNDTAEIIGEPEIGANSLGEIIITVRYSNPFKKITSFRSTDGGKTWGEVGIHETDEFPRQYTGTSMSLPRELGLIWIDLAQTPGQSTGNTNWEIFFKRTLNSGTTWQDLRRLTNEAGYSYNPVLAWSGKLLALWANRDVSVAPWKRT